jgi:hypothetical protein
MYSKNGAKILYRKFFFYYYFIFGTYVFIYSDFIVNINVIF